MKEPDRSVFISYRRDPDWSLARLVFDDLSEHGYDVFMDVETLHSGIFDTALLDQIQARAHFILILTSHTLERCSDPDDWVRREIEYAMDVGRNIIPLMFHGFRFDDHVQSLLTGKLKELPRHNGLNVPSDFFGEAMQKLRERFLSQLAHGRIVPEMPVEQPAVHKGNEEGAEQSFVIEEGLSAEECLRRGLAYSRRGDLDRAIAYCSESIRLNPKLSPAYNNRAVARSRKGDTKGAVTDYARAIRLDPQNPVVYNNRAEALFVLKRYTQALVDFEMSRRLKPDFENAIAGLAVTDYVLGHRDNALQLWRKLVKKNKSYLDIHWVWQNLSWPDPLVEQARALIADYESK